jgi:hypothetical protein
MSNVSGYQYTSSIPTKAKREKRIIHQFLIELKYARHKIAETTSNLTFNNSLDFPNPGCRIIMIKEVIIIYIKVNFSTEKKRIE